MNAKQNLKRPVFLNLLQIRLPLTALISILHRISGVVIFLSIPLFLCVLRNSLSSPHGFEQMALYFAMPSVKFVFWLLLSALMYHVFAGIRHLVMDMGFGETLRAARFLSFIVLLLTLFFMIALGVRLWSVQAECVVH